MTTPAGPERPILSEGPVAPFHATVKVIPTRVRRSRMTATPRDVDFLVQLDWTGPPAPYMPPDPRPGERRDVYVTGNPEHAKAIARTALATLGRGEIPDLRDIAKDIAGRLAAGPYG